MKDSLLAFLDVETTGFDPLKHEIIQIGVVIARQNKRAGKGPELEIVEELDLKVKPTNIETADEEALRINGYNEGEWMFAPDLKPTMELLAKKLEGAIMVAHNLAFDNSFIEAAWKKTGVENTMKRYKLDTISIAFARFYERDGDMRYSLGYLCDIFGIKNENAHTALSDAKALYQVYKKMMNA